MPKLLTIETRSGQPLQVGRASLTPFSQSWQFRIPAISGGLIWNRPVSVLVTDANGREQVIRVPDVTRQVQLALIGACALAAIFLRLMFRKS
ncbi:MAG TPA: hypothetical protein VF498_06540 [Anaerolineales bacterium]